MPGWLKILVVLVVIGYILFPWDLLPDFFPILGRVDDLLVLAAVVYFWVAGRLPGIFKSFQDTLKNEGSRAGTDEPTPGTGRGRPADPYQVLGISREATPDEIRAAYRKASQEYHPDKVAHLGRELQDLANKKFIEIQKSYEYLRSKGGW